MTRKWFSLLSLFSIVGLMAMSLSVRPALAALTGTPFELDGNAIKNTADDWDTLYNLGPAPPAQAQLPLLAFSGITADPAPKTIFTGGGSKDDLDIGNWNHTDGSVPDKDDITNAYAAAYQNAAGELIITFGADRYATNGNAALGFWFFQQDVAPRDDGSGKFSGAHTGRDVLVLSEFTNGGSQPTIQVYEWVVGGLGPINGTLRLLTDVNSACNTGGLTSDACAIVNTGTAASPWTYIAKGKSVDSDFPKGAFFEGAINLTKLFPGGTPCISSFLAETRSSQSVDATLKDFDAGDFNLCGASITMGPSAVNEVNDNHTFDVQVNKIAAGTSSGVADTLVDITLTHSDPTATITPAGPYSCTTDANGACSVTFTSNKAGTVTGVASATVSFGGATFEVQTGTGANNPNPVKRFVDARIAILPDDTNGIGEPHTFTVDVDQNDGLAAGSPGDAVSGFGPASDGHVDVTLTDAGGAVNQIDAAASTCDDLGDNLDANGQCTIKFVSNTAGTVTGHASVSLNLGLTSGALVVRETDNANGNTDDAVKTYIDGTLRWLKHDQDGALLGGATFEVCRTHDFVSADGSFADVADACVSVLDNGVEDADKDNGEFQRNDLILGRYTIKETAAPTGYEPDSSIKTVELTIAVPSNVASAPIFVNVQLFKMIILTCNQVTNQLVVSEVNLNGVITSTLGSAPAGLTSEQLCGLGGATYQNLSKGTYNPSVKIPQ